MVLPPWQRFRFVTFPLLTPIIAIVMTFSVLFTFTDFQLIYVLTRGGPVNATHLMATLSFQRGISGGNLGEGAAIAVAMIPFLLAAISVQLLRPAAPPLAAGRKRLMSNVARSRDPTASRAGDEGGMNLSAAVAAPRGDSVPAACHLRVRVALPVLLDGNHRH